MSLQRSELPIHPKDDSAVRPPTHHTSNTNNDVTLDLDPYAAPNVYYGTSHSSRKVAKSRTYSAVGLDSEI